MANEQEEINFDAELESTQQEESIEEEIKSDQLNETPIESQQKYERPNLDGKDVKILSAKVFKRESNPVITSVNNPNVKYRKVNFVITYESKNKDEINDREYISGAIQFQQREGGYGQVNFWNKGAKNQSAMLWELVAKKKDKQPEKMSQKEFYDFLNSGITVKLKYVDTQWKNETYHKNLPMEIL